MVNLAPFHAQADELREARAEIERLKAEKKLAETEREFWRLAAKRDSAEIEMLTAVLSRIAYDEWEDGLALGENYNVSFLKGLAIKALKGGAPETSNRCLDRAEKQEIARLKGGDDD